MRLILGTFILALGFSTQTASISSAAIRGLVGRLNLESYKARIRGLTQFGDRMQGTQRNRDAINWLEAQLKSYGYTNVQRHKFMSGSGELENVDATQIGRSQPLELYL